MHDPKGDVSGTISLEKTLDDIEALRKAAGHKKWIVFGQSWGVILGLLYAAKYPNSVEHLILTSVPGLGHDGTYLSDNLRLPKDLELELIAVELDQQLSPSQKIAKQVLAVLPYYFYDREQGLTLAKIAPDDLFNPEVFIALAKYIRDDREYRLRLASIKGQKYPVTMIQGRQDPCGAEMPFALKEKYIPRAQVSHIARTGHFAWMEQPGDFFDSFHEALSLKKPEWVTNWGQPDQSAFTTELRLRTEANWPFGK